MATLTHPAREANRSENRTDVTPMSQFSNEPMIDWSDPENLRRMQAAIEKVRSELGREYDLVIGGRRIKTGDTAPSINPAKPSEVVGMHHQAGPAEVEPAMQAALKAFESWSRTTLEERVQLLFRVGQILQQRKFELEAWLVFEVGKNFAEADGDVAELIDFCHMYALEALRLGQAKTVVQLPGEHDQFRYIPLGVGAVISPWNFPGRDHGRHDSGFDCEREHCRPQAFRRFANYRCQVLRNSGRGRHARRRRELLPRTRLQLRERHCRAPQDALHRLHRIQRSGPAHQPDGGHATARPNLDQAHRP